LSTEEAVDLFIKGLISNFSPFHDHQDIESGELQIDCTRRAYIGKMEGQQCAWWAIWDELQSANDIAAFLETEKTLQLCIPVQRKQRDEDLTPLKLKPGHKRLRQSRVNSVGQSQDTKRPRSSTRLTVDSKVKEEVKEEIKEEIKVEVKGEVKGEVGLQLDVSLSSEGSEGEIDVNLKVEATGRKRNTKLPARYRS